MAERWREGKGEMEEKEWTERERERERERGRERIEMDGICGMCSILQTAQEM